MGILYNIFIAIFNSILPVIGLLSPKLKLFANGRKTVFETLEQHFPSQDRILWFHCASLGEYEQGVPVIEGLKKKYSDHKVLVTFFSPSGYEAKKNSTLADIIVYLPIDTNANAIRFIQLVKPELAVFVKYEFWPNYLKVLQNRNVPAVFISATFREDQAFFKWYGGFMRKTLQTVDHFFVQDKISQTLIEKQGFANVTLSGDTRFDRVSHQIEMDNHVDFISEFINERLCIVMGSSWPEDEEVFMDYINEASDKVCFIIAPHEIKDNSTNTLKRKIKKKTVLYSEKEGKVLKDQQVFIVNTIGYLSRVYSYADIAYVGGAMGTGGLHNILEPATFGIPIVIGKNFEKFREAKQLQKLAGLFSVSSADEFNQVLNKLVEGKKFREKTGMISGHFINSNTGATAMIMAYLIKKIN
ncbi:3-deoxy-D-manno-octulosonic-acid transferase [Aquimarina sp. EL_43]|uniref:3-deoxy-D-manno-octulosonic acid transferase n=1 Tax=unclassified Aquimarina TaxID=2627091 RepID=UPI0018C95F73|nr:MULTISPECIES: glycosyltransferase N-terminal domain-containing protein [unclassified Aquimarina]MBG6131407.1 3-deoxy-D-manno-octulosonic-acid transferase [Aquimarina sp. EL_35]MBG6151710.1 3-deoxy-D-manno-octulosonic-acid transferase [Aquimarina sp. EL_32]MBG6169640.1 3-deoxy-D-manno-octulosonic-acid transferase [Aquimarina sp. EL_43]